MAIKVEVIERDPWDHKIQGELLEPQVYHQWQCPCGSKVFEVFYGDFHTYVRCTACQYVSDVHSG